MANHKKGTGKWMQSMIQKLGSEEAVRQFMKERGAIGGKKSKGGGFTGDPERARLYGSIGGKLSKRKGTKNKS
jgi:general stress protein YciG